MLAMLTTCLMYLDTTINGSRESFAYEGEAFVFELTYIHLGVLRASSVFMSSNLLDSNGQLGGGDGALSDCRIQ